MNGNVHLHWYLPTNGDSRGLTGSGTDSHIVELSGGFRALTLAYLGQVARAAEEQHFHSVLTPTGTWCEDAWITTAALSHETKRLKFLVAFRPGLISPTLVAHQAATFQRMTGGRLLLNVVTGGDRFEQGRFGDHLEHDARYERTEEFLSVVRGVTSAPAGQPFSFKGKHYDIREANIDTSPYDLPQIFFGGASPAAQEVAAGQADVYLVWGRPPALEAENIAQLKARAAARGRSLRFGVRLHVISRDTEDEAWAMADKLLAWLSPERVRKNRELLAKSESVAQSQMSALHAGLEGLPASARELEIYPGLWSGYGLVRGGAGTALVGSHAQVADLIEAYHRAGFDHFILSGQPHLEEAWHFGEGAAALLKARGLLAAVSPQS
ncbi:LLM class flavin-dependent oxidoreductase [Agrobacterium rhizogenes]|nr:LLM class flavin-dependent oxidoreductase [Rhizobium rhizogenes]NTI98404.1 LLM class flavin-dependent oxidoreductase [Rhizobium rhizogenes]NTJ60832.1 LLM class flavin-dependent oxidoreductase [Rhizobium rhizogenes]OCJ28534.1 alkanesulfonate monooxygenase [Agrobacterium sp. B133/95]